MKFSAKLLAGALLPLASVATIGISAPAAAQSKLGVAIVDVEKAVYDSNAYTVARQQMETTYKANIDQFRSRQTAIDTDLKTKQTALQTALSAAGGKTTPALEEQYRTLQQSAQAGQAELQRLGQPVQLANAYVQEQIGTKLREALLATQTQAKVDVLLNNEATVSYAPAADVTAILKQQLDRLVPSVSIVPPAGWRPGGQQQGAAAAPAAPATAQPSGR